MPAQPVGEVEERNAVDCPVVEGNVCGPHGVCGYDSDLKNTRCFCTSDYSGEELPNNYTMDQLSLGDLETVTPVLGYINSGYGYRDHPISGVYQFHGGVDISGKTGDPIQAFAAGTVEYVGEDDSFGLYLQLDHGNGVKSFYAHCSAVCVKKGQTVALGEKIAEVGASGTATGPHLHLELKYNKMHLNPIYYITYLSR